MDAQTTQRVLDEARTDAATFAAEFPGELLDPAKTDWDAEAWALAPADLRAAAGAAGWALYKRALVEEVARLVERRNAAWATIIEE